MFSSSRPSRAYSVCYLEVSQITALAGHSSYNENYFSGKSRVLNRRENAHLLGVRNQAVHEDGILTEKSMMADYRQTIFQNNTLLRGLAH